MRLMGIACEVHGMISTDVYGKRGVEEGMRTIPMECGCVLAQQVYTSQADFAKCRLLELGSEKQTRCKTAEYVYNDWGILNHGYRMRE